MVAEKEAAHRLMVDMRKYVLRFGKYLQYPMLKRTVDDTGNTTGSATERPGSL